MNRQRLVGYYNYTVILTYVGMLAGFRGICLAYDGNVHGAMVCLMTAGVCDMFDGAIARTKVRTEEERSFGIQIDSLSDLICFGVLPGMLTYGLSGKSLAVTVIISLYVLCALIRLAFFNVDELERQRNSTEEREFYLGLPVTMAALLVPLVYGVCCRFSFNVGRIMAISILLMSLMFILPFRIRKPRLPGKLLFLVFGGFEIYLVVLSGVVA